jgi:hypothetical protein
MTRSSSSAARRGGLEVVGPAIDSAGRGSVDFDLHGLARVRLLDAEAGDIAAVRRQVGPIEAAVAGDADLVVRFVDRLETRGRTILLGAREAAFTDDAFLVLRSKHKARARVSVPMADVGRSGCEVVCERGAPAVPLLVPMLNLTVLGKGALPLHAGAFVHRGVGVVCTGWSKGGKTETLLAFTQRGAAYVGDEWVYLGGDGSTVHGIPEPLRLWDSHLSQLPHVGRRIDRGSRRRLAALRAARRVGTATPGRLGRMADRALPLVESQLHVDVPPEQLFPPRLRPMTGPFDHLLLVLSADVSRTTTEPIDPDEVAARMAASLAYERLPFLSWYQAFRYAFPDAVNPIVERAGDRERILLHQLLQDKPAHAVYHRYPVNIAGLYEAINPLLS